MEMPECCMCSLHLGTSQKDFWNSASLDVSTGFNSGLLSASPCPIPSADTFSNILGYFLITNVLELEEMMLLSFWDGDLDKLWQTTVWLCRRRLKDALKYLELLWTYPSNIWQVLSETVLTCIKRKSFLRKLHRVLEVIVLFFCS